MDHFNTDAFKRELGADPSCQAVSAYLPIRRQVSAMEQARLAGSLAKRGLDLIVAGASLLVIVPVLAVLCIGIRLDSRGPLFFRQRRSGLNGEIINVLKLRTMHVMENAEDVRQARMGDPRITRFGAFLRRTSLDELPQVFNVLAGNMSLVGPRPHALAHDHQFRGLVEGYDLRFRAKPGITGLAQVKGHRGGIASPQQIVDRVVSDNHYIDNWSFWMDLKIIFKTFHVVLRCVNAY